MPITKLTVTPEIARLRDGYGSRNVRVGGKDGLLLTISNRHPVYVAKVPPEVEADAQIVKTEIDDAAMAAAGGQLTALPGDSQPAVAVDKALAAASDFQGKYAAALPKAAPGIEAAAEVEVEMPAPPVELQDTVVITDPKTDPDKVNKSNLKKAKPAGRKAKAKR